jgi:type I restriction enzyme S subunit
VIYSLPVESSARPSDWVIKPVKELADVVGGGTPDTGVTEYWNPPEYEWVTPTDISNCDGRVLYKTERQISAAGLQDSSATLLPTGTTLLTSRATIGECKLAGIQVATNQGFASLVPKVKEEADFIFYLAQWLKPTLVRLAAGTTFIEVSRREIRRINICVPKESEERKKIGRLLSAADHDLSTAKGKVRAAVLLKTALMQQLFTRGIPSRHQSFICARVFRHAFEVPTAWETAPLGNSVEAIEYGTNAASNDAGHGLPIIAIPEVLSSRFKLGECSFVELPETEALALRLQSDDILVIRTNGNPDYIGKSTAIGDEADTRHIVFASYLIRIRTNKRKLSGRYLNYFLASPLGRRQCLAMANTSAGNHNLGARSIRRFCLPRPSTTEQAEIVEAVDSAEDAIEAANREIECLERFKRSLLQNLFSGRIRVTA